MNAENRNTLLVSTQSNTDSTKKEKWYIKVLRISRHVVLATIFIVTFMAFTYSVSIPLACSREVEGKTCALSLGKHMCSRSSNTALALAMTMLLFGVFACTARYKVFVYGFMAAITMQGLYLSVICLYKDPAFLTKKSSPSIVAEMMTCKVVNNITMVTEDGHCWENFRDVYCPKWQIVESQFCRKLSDSCEPGSSLWCSDDESRLYVNHTAVSLVEQCVEEYESWVFTVTQFYFHWAVSLLLNTTIIHVILWTIIASNVVVLHCLQKNNDQLSTSFFVSDTNQDLNFLKGKSS